VSPANDEQPARAAAHALPIAALTAFAKAQPATGEPTTAAEPSKAAPTTPAAAGEATKVEGKVATSKTDKTRKNAAPAAAKLKP
jgi:hypothetical protein